MKPNPLSRDGQFAATASVYADACNEERAVIKEIDESRRRYEVIHQKAVKLSAELTEFVGQNIRTKTAIVGNTVVRVDFNDGKPKVTIEEATRAG